MPIESATPAAVTHNGPAHDGPVHNGPAFDRTGPPVLIPTDGELLMRFARHGDEEALALVVDRHAEMVWGVCNRVLAHRHEAEDAFQATLLILAEKADSIRANDSVAGWLFRVAHRTALAARRRRKTRREEPLVDEPLVPEEQFPAIHRRQASAALMEELRGLPERYQTPLVLRYLEGQSRRRIAEVTDATVATVAGRLVRGKRMLRMRLARRGVSLAAAIGAFSLANESIAADAIGAPTTITPPPFDPTGAASTVVSQLVTQGTRSMMIASLAKPAAACAACLVAALGLFVDAKSPAADAAGSRPGVVLNATPAAEPNTEAPAIAVAPTPEKASRQRQPREQPTQPPIEPASGVLNLHTDSPGTLTISGETLTVGPGAGFVSVGAPASAESKETSAESDEIAAARKLWAEKARAEAGLDLSQPSFAELFAMRTYWSAKQVAAKQRMERLLTLRKQGLASKSPTEINETRAQLQQAKAKILEVERQMKQAALRETGAQEAAVRGWQRAWGIPPTPANPLAAARTPGAITPATPTPYRQPPSAFQWPTYGGPQPPAIEKYSARPADGPDVVVLEPLPLEEQNRRLQDYIGELQAELERVSPGWSARQPRPTPPQPRPTPAVGAPIPPHTGPKPVAPLRLGLADSVAPADALATPRPLPPVAVEENLTAPAGSQIDPELLARIKQAVDEHREVRSLETERRLIATMLKAERSRASSRSTIARRKGEAEPPESPKSKRLSKWLAEMDREIRQLRERLTREFQQSPATIGGDATRQSSLSAEQHAKIKETFVKLFQENLKKQLNKDKLGADNAEGPAPPLSEESQREMVETFKRAMLSTGEENAPEDADAGPAPDAEGSSPGGSASLRPQPPGGVISTPPNVDNLVVDFFRSAPESQRTDGALLERLQLLEESGRHAEAIAAYQQAIADNAGPRWILRNNLAYRLATADDPAVRDPEAAVAQAQLAIAEAPQGTEGHAELLDTLAVAQRAAGDSDAARRTMQQARDRAQGRVDQLKELSAKFEQPAASAKSTAEIEALQELVNANLTIWKKIKKLRDAGAQGGSAEREAAARAAFYGAKARLERARRRASKSTAPSLYETNRNRAVAAEREVEAMQKAFDAGRASLDLLHSTLERRVEAKIALAEAEAAQQSASQPTPVPATNASDHAAMLPTLRATLKALEESPFAKNHPEQAAAQINALRLRIEMQEAAATAKAPHDGSLGIGQPRSITRLVVQGPVTTGGRPRNLKRPSDEEILRVVATHESSLGQPPPYRSGDTHITLEKTADYADPPRVYPLVGEARLHHAHYTCKIYASKDSIRPEDTYYLDHMHLDILSGHEPLLRNDPQPASTPGRIVRGSQYGPDSKTKQGEWRVFHKPSELNPHGWATVAELPPGKQAPILLPGDARPRPHLELHKVDGEQLYLRTIDEPRRGDHITIVRRGTGGHVTTVREQLVQVYYLAMTGGAYSHSPNREQGAALVVIRGIPPEMAAKALAGELRAPDEQAAVRLLRQRSARAAQPTSGSVIKAGDRLLVEVTGTIDDEPTLFPQVSKVQPDGGIVALNKADRYEGFSVGGLTLAEAAESMSEFFAEGMDDPVVNVTRYQGSANARDFLKARANALRNDRTPFVDFSVDANNPSPPKGEIVPGIGLRIDIPDEGPSPIALGFADLASTLKHGDGEADGKKSLGGSGHLVRFEMPGGGTNSGEMVKIKAIRIHGSRYGTKKPPREDFEITFTNHDMGEVLAVERAAYGRFRRGEEKWVTIRFKQPVELPAGEPFWVALDFDPGRTKGVYVSYDTSTKGEHSRVGLAAEPDEVKECDFKGDWMVQVVLDRSDNRRAAEKALQTRRR